MKHMSWLERLFLGKDTVAKLDAAKQRLEENEAASITNDEEEQRQRQEIYKLVTVIRSNAERSSARPLNVLRHVSIPDIPEEQ